MIIVDKNVLKAIALFKTKKGVRDYLKGVHVDITNNQAFLVATDGSAIAAYCVHVDLPDDDYVIPGDIVDQVAKLGGKTVIIDKTVITVEGVRIEYTPMDKIYPLYRRVFPSSITGEPSVIDSNYLDMFNKANKLICKSKFNPIAILHNGEGASLVRINDNRFIGAVMGIRNHEHLFNASFPSGNQEK